MKKYLNLLGLSVGAYLVGVVSAQAQLIAYDGFNYPAAPPGTFVGSNGGVGDWAGAWTDKNNLTAVIAPGMSYSTLPVVGNSIAAQGTTASSEAERVLNSTFGTYATANTYEANTLYMSYLWNGLTTSADGNTFRQASMMFLQGATSASGSGSEYLDVGMPNISAATVGTVHPDISLWYGGHGLAGQTSSANAPIQSTVAANSGATDFILIQMVMDNVNTTADTMNIWINPALTGATPVGTPDFTYTLQDLSSLNGIRLQAGSSNANGIGMEQGDEIRFGDTANAVETLSVVVPEPASMALLGLGALGLLIFRRK
jgi:hypothetical protein